MSSKGDNNSHARWRILLEKHIDGELDAPGRMELFAHLEECEECRETLEAEERLVDHLSRLPRLTAPSDLRAAILREAARERAEALLPLTEDDRYSELFDVPTPGSGEERNTMPDPHRTESASRPRRPSRPRHTWRRLSPRLATAFLIFSVTLTILTRGLLSELPKADLPGLGLQASTRAVVQAARQVLSPSPREAAVEELPSQPASLTGISAEKSLGPVLPVVPSAHAGYREPDARTMISAERGLDETRNDMGRLISMAAGIPLPAEQESIPAGAIVLQLEKSVSEPDGGKKLAATVQQVLVKRLGGSIRKYEESERLGQRRRMFTVDLSEEGVSELLRVLQPWRRVVPESGMTTVTEWLQASMGDEDVNLHVDLFTASVDEFRRILDGEQAPEIAAGQYNGKRIHLLLVE